VEHELWDFVANNGLCDTAIYPEYFDFNCDDFYFEDSDCSYGGDPGTACLPNAETWDTCRDTGCTFDCSGQCWDNQAFHYANVNSVCDDGVNGPLNLQCNAFEDCKRADSGAPHRAQWFFNGSKYNSSNPHLVSYEDYYGDQYGYEVPYEVFEVGDVLEIQQDLNTSGINWFGMSSGDYQEAMVSHTSNWVSVGTFTIKTVRHDIRPDESADELVSFIEFEDLSVEGQEQLFNSNAALVEDAYAECWPDVYPYGCYWGFGAYYNGYNIRIFKQN
jgi:hypothetical protein